YRGGPRRLPARPRGHLLRGRARAGARDAPLDCGGGGRDRQARGRAAACAHAPLDPLFRRRRRPRGACDLPRDGRAARLRPDRGAVPRAGSAEPREGWRARPASGSRIIGLAVNTMVQVAVAGDVTEAEEIQAILTNVGIETQLSTPEDDADAVTVLVQETDLETALDALEALTEPDDLVGEA